MHISAPAACALLRDVQSLRTRTLSSISLQSGALDFGMSDPLPTRPTPAARSPRFGSSQHTTGHGPATPTCLTQTLKPAGCPRVLDCNGKPLLLRPADRVDLHFWCSPPHVNLVNQADGLYEIMVSEFIDRPLHTRVHQSAKQVSRPWPRI
ncbi:hypothetical protein GOBAR_AA37988 [Gossypium barbadense]|uniref:Uncharacterized protein n=1 Tax=Gossypium barbadense TaxID=3634 RepID=A0A2P5VV72_GOSBA|nr:hypothetical protein GOBAR_AA37988 [Gossypium barbadense]